MVAECRCLFQAACAVTDTSKEKEIRNDPPGRGVGGPARPRGEFPPLMFSTSAQAPRLPQPTRRLQLQEVGAAALNGPVPGPSAAMPGIGGGPPGHGHGDAPSTVAAAAAVAPEAALDPSPAAAASGADGASSASSYDGIRTLVASSLASISSPTTRGALSRIADGLIDFMKGSLLPAPPSAAALCSPPPPRPVPALLAVV